MTEWQKIKQVRPPNAPGHIRVRITAPILGMTLTPEWSVPMVLCGMGYGDKEWWPEGINEWNGFGRRFISDYEWRSIKDGDDLTERVQWHGLGLLTCPFTGNPPLVEYRGRWIGAPPDKADMLIIRSWLVEFRSVDAARLVSAWNQRAPLKAEVA